MKAKLKNFFLYFLIAFLICCNSVSYHQVAVETPHKIIAIEDSLNSLGLTKKNQDALALAHKKVAVMHLKEKNYTDAKVHFSNVLKYSTFDSIAQYNILMIDGHMLRQTGSRKKLWDAIEIYYKAQRLYPNNGEPYFFIGKAYQSLDKNDFDLILESYQKALELDLSKPLIIEIEKEMLLVQTREKKLKDFWK